MHWISFRWISWKCLERKKFEAANFQKKFRYPEDVRVQGLPGQPVLWHWREVGLAQIFTSQSSNQKKKASRHFLPKFFDLSLSHAVVSRRCPAFDGSQYFYSEPWICTPGNWIPWIWCCLVLLPKTNKLKLLIGNYPTFSSRCKTNFYHRDIEKFLKGYGRVRNISVKVGKGKRAIQFFSH